MSQSRPGLPPSRIWPGGSFRPPSTFSFWAPILPSLYPLLPHIPGPLIQPPAPGLFHGPASPSPRRGPIFPTPNTWDTSTPGCPPHRYPQPLCPFPLFFAGFLPLPSLAGAAVISELPSPAALTLPPLLLCSELADSRRKSPLFPPASFWCEKASSQTPKSLTPSQLGAGRRAPFHLPPHPLIPPPAQPPPGQHHFCGCVASCLGA